MTPSTRFLNLLEELRVTHIAKSAGYAGEDNPDTFANFRECEGIDVPAYKGAFIRLQDKYKRSKNLIKNPKNNQVGESLRDTLIDLSSYALIVLCLWEELEDEKMKDKIVNPVRMVD